MSWVLLGAAWLVLALAVGILIGRSIREADARTTTDEPNFVVDPAEADVAPAAEAGADADREADVETPPKPTVETPPRPPREAPTVPGLPVARPAAGAPGSRTPRVPRPGRKSESA